MTYSYGMHCAHMAKHPNYTFNVIYKELSVCEREK